VIFIEFVKLVGQQLRIFLGDEPSVDTGPDYSANRSLIRREHRNAGCQRLQAG
jgi:hypothetical protein